MFSIFGLQRRIPLSNCQFLNNLNFENSLVILISLAKNHGKLMFDIDMHQVVFFFLKLEKRDFFVIFTQTRSFLEDRGGGFFFVFFQTLFFQKLLLRFNNKKIIFYHISHDFCNFLRGGSTKFRIWVSFNYISNIS